MKTITLTLAIILTLSMNVLFAGHAGPSVSTESISFHISLAPGTPAEATFYEMPGAPVLNLAPVTPVEADFQDAAADNTMDFSALAPATPVEADFAADDSPMLPLNILIPVTPSVADFSDGI
jgi:hypothetical protein